MINGLARRRDGAQASDVAQPDMVDRSRIRHQLQALVLRADKPHTGFTWELREYGKGETLEAGPGLYSSQAEARIAGEAALARFKADGR